MADVPTRRVIYIDLDGTMVWAWSPLITTASLARLFNAKIESPPKTKEGYRRLTKVWIGDDHVLACSRPNMRRFLSVLRRAAAVLMVTHASRDYALAMNRAFKLGFTADQIFTVGSKLHRRFGEALLIDDEGECGGDYGAYQRHREKCSILNIVAGSSHDFPLTPFAGLRNDLFSRPKAWGKIGKRVIHALNQPSRPPRLPKEDPDPPYTLVDFDSPDSQERIENICGSCLSTTETARLLSVSNRTVMNRYLRDELISFRALRGKNQRRFPKWQFESNRAARWLRPLIRAFGQNGWSLIEFLVIPRPTSTHLQRLLRGITHEVKQVLSAAERHKVIREKAPAPKLWQAGPTSYSARRNRELLDATTQERNHFPTRH